jgi:CheY-like chemotaxis protein
MDFVRDNIAPLDVLLVEDDEVDVMNVQRSFRKNKVPHRLQIANDGLQALEMLRNNVTAIPQVILLDINMPRMGGLEFLRELRSDPRLHSIAVFIMSTSDNPIDKETAYQYNVAGYIVKPLSAEKFNQAISKLVAFWEICEFV